MSEKFGDKYPKAYGILHGFLFMLPFLILVIGILLLPYLIILGL